MSLAKDMTWETAVEQAAAVCCLSFHWLLSPHTSDCSVRGFTLHRVFQDERYSIMESVVLYFVLKRVSVQNKGSSDQGKLLGCEYHSWGCSWSVWMRLWATWSNDWRSYPQLGCWNYVIFKVPSNPDHSVVPWFSSLQLYNLVMVMDVNSSIALPWVQWGLQWKDNWKGTSSMGINI